MMANPDFEHKHTILLVDDEQPVLDMLERIMLGEGYTVLTAQNGAEALDIAEAIQLCLVITDVSMPGMDGFELCRRLKRNRRNAHLPCVLVTGQIAKEDFEQGMAVGAVDYIKKPFDQEELRLRIRSQIHLHQARHCAESLQARLQVISRAANDAIVMIDPAGNITHWNEAAETMFGYSVDEAIGRNLHHLVAPERSHPQSLRGFREFQKTGAGNAVGRTLELIGLRRNGMEFPVELSLSATQLDGQWIAVGIVRDITERKQAEAQMLQMELDLRHSQKLEAVGQLAAGIAHEINTPAQFVGDSIGFFKEAHEDICRLIEAYRHVVDALEAGGADQGLVSQIRATEEEIDLEYLLTNVPASTERAIDGIGRISSIVRAMKEFAHPDQRDRSPADLNRAISATLTISRNEYKYVADIETDFGELPAVMCHLGDLNQVFLNLIVNAAHAIADVVGNTNTKGIIRIGTRTEGECVRIDISDTGNGIPEAMRHRVFDPFFTTKPIGKGTGQGLTIARSIVVDKHSGSLTFESAIGHGTTFTIQLPVKAAKNNAEGLLS